ncbi:HTH-type transcriptional regulator GltC [Terrabacter sp. BE26]
MSRGGVGMAATDTLGAMFNPLHLRTLMTVVRTGSFADAARELGYTASAVSQQMALLERQVRMPLFDRSPRSVTATPTAVMIAERARESLSALDVLDEEVIGLAQGRLGVLRVGSFPTASQRLLPVALAHYKVRHQGVHIELDEAEADTLAARVADGQGDLALAYRYDLVPRSLPEGLCSERLLDEELLLLLPADDPLADADAIALTDLQPRTWVTTRVGTPGTECLHRLCAEYGFAPQISFRSNDYAVIHEFVRRGFGIALIPALSHTPSAGIRSRRLDGVTARRHVHVLVRSRMLNPAVADFVQSLHAAAAQVAEDHPDLSA